MQEKKTAQGKSWKSFSMSNASDLALGGIV